MAAPSRPPAQSRAQRWSLPPIIEAFSRRDNSLTTLKPWQRFRAGPAASGLRPDEGTGHGKQPPGLLPCSIATDQATCPDK